MPVVPQEVVIVSLETGAPVHERQGVSDAHFTLQCGGLTVYGLNDYVGFLKLGDAPAREVKDFSRTLGFLAAAFGTSPGGGTSSEQRIARIVTDCMFVDETMRALPAALLEVMKEQTPADPGLQSLATELAQGQTLTFAGRMGPTRITVRLTAGPKIAAKLSARTGIVRPETLPTRPLGQTRPSTLALPRRAKVSS